LNADYTAEELAFEIEVRTFLENEFPAEYKAKVDANIRLGKEELTHWQKKSYLKRVGLRLAGL